MNLDAEILAAPILVVDDQAANLALMQRVLAQAGYTRVTATADPTEVCALHRREAHDLILLDLQMPVMDGFEVMDGLKADGAGADLPVIVLTARPEHKLRALQAGARDFIRKPFELLELTTRIRQTLELRLLYRRLQAHCLALEQAVRERTAELNDSQARYRSLAELASDWYWEQDANGAFTRVSGPVLEMLGLRLDPLSGVTPEPAQEGWDPAERATLWARIIARQPFLDYTFHRTLPDGARRQFRVSGEPMFDEACSYRGYRGIGVEVLAAGAP